MKRVTSPNPSYGDILEALRDASEGNLRITLSPAAAEVVLLGLEERDATAEALEALKQTMGWHTVEECPR